MFCFQDVDELLQRVCGAESVQEIEQFGLVLVQHVRLARQRQNDITAQEMKAVMEERDGSVTKVSQHCAYCYLVAADSRVNVLNLCLDPERYRILIMFINCRNESVSVYKFRNKFANPRTLLLWGDSYI